MSAAFIVIRMYTSGNSSGSSVHSGPVKPYGIGGLRGHSSPDAEGPDLQLAEDPERRTGSGPETPGPFRHLLVCRLVCGDVIRRVQEQ